MNCPKCHGTLKPVQADATEIDQCDACGGFWFDQAELKFVLTGGLAKVIDPGADLFTAARDSFRGSCPRCDVIMEQVESIAVEGLTYDQCPACSGVWLDRGELAQASDPEAALEMGFFTDN